MEDVTGFKDAQYLQIASEEGVSQHRTALLGKAVACRQTFACVHAPHVNNYIIIETPPHLLSYKPVLTGEQG